MHEPQILIVEDDAKIAALLRDYLQAAGLRVELLADGAAVEPFVRRSEPALVLLDVRLPGKSGLDVLRELRRFSAVPVIMVTAMVEEIDRLLGLELGADDYICKPFSPREVVARVRATLRRVELDRRGVDGNRGPFVVDDAAMRITLRGALLDLTPTEFRLLRALLLSPGRVFSRAQLLDAIREDTDEVFDRVIDTHVKNLRRKLAAVDGERQYLRSVYGVGYKFELDP